MLVQFNRTISCLDRTNQFESLTMLFSLPAVSQCIAELHGDITFCSNIYSFEGKNFFTSELIFVI